MWICNGDGRLIMWVGGILGILCISFSYFDWFIGKWFCLISFGICNIVGSVDVGDENNIYLGILNLLVIICMNWGYFN